MADVLYEVLCKPELLVESKLKAPPWYGATCSPDGSCSCHNSFCFLTACWMFPTTCSPLPCPLRSVGALYGPSCGAMGGVPSSSPPCLPRGPPTQSLSGGGGGGAAASESGSGCSARRSPRASGSGSGSPRSLPGSAAAAAAAAKSRCTHGNGEEVHETLEEPPLEEEPLGSFSVRNLDTGEVHDVRFLEELGQEFFQFRPLSSDSKTGDTPGCSPWDGWWQEHREQLTKLFEAAATGDSDRIKQLLFSNSRSQVSQGGSAVRNLVGSAVNDDRLPPPLQISGPEASNVQLHPDARVLQGRTALHIAADAGHADCVEVLLSLGADIDVQTDSGLSAMHLACQRGHLEAVCALLAAGCDTSAQTDQGELALHLAAAKGHQQVVALLLDSCSLELFRVRSSYGQRPSEVCLDIDTARVFQGSPGHRSLFHGSFASGSSSTGSTSSEVFATQTPGGDHYAGRTLFEQGSVLLRNSRSDAVKRLLRGPPTDGKLLGTEGEPPCSPLPSEKENGKENEKLPAHELRKARPGKGDGLRGSVRFKVDSDPSPAIVSPFGAIADANAFPTKSDHLRRRPSFTRLQDKEGCGIQAVGPNSFRFLSVLGRGSFGEVFHVAHKVSGQVFAMKVLRKSKIMSKNLIRYALTERNLLSYIRHPFIVRMHYAFQTPSSLVLVLHYCSGGNLSALLLREGGPGGGLSEALARLYVAEVLLALEHLHERKVVYRDLKPENVVLDGDGHAMLTDFGLSKEGVAGRTSGTKSFCGSVAYLAPEILARSGHGPAVDLYGLGVLLYEVLAGQPPFYSRDREALFRNISAATLHAPAKASKRASQLIFALMQRDPEKRLGNRNTSEVRSHSFFAGLDFEKVLRREVSVPQFRRHQLPGVDSVVQNTAVAKVASPFEGRLEAQVRRSWSSTSQDVEGWDFSSGADPVSSTSELRVRTLSRSKPQASIGSTGTKRVRASGLQNLAPPATKFQVQLQAGQLKHLLDF